MIGLRRGLRSHRNIFIGQKLGIERKDAMLYMFFIVGLTQHFSKSLEDAQTKPII